MGEKVQEGNECYELLTKEEGDFVESFMWNAQESTHDMGEEDFVDGKPLNNDKPTGLRTYFPYEANGFPHHTGSMVVEIDNGTKLLVVEPQWKATIYSKCEEQ